MELRMNDVPLDNPAVAGVMFRCLKECGRVFDEALIESEPMMPRDDWNKLRVGVGHILGSDMLDMWNVIVQKHPQFLSEIGENGGGRRS